MFTLARSAEGAAFSSHGRKAVDQNRNEIEARRAGTVLRRECGLVPHLRRSTLFFGSIVHGLTAVAI